MEKTNSFAVKIVTLILVLLLLAGVAGGIMSLFFKSLGMYVVYNGTIITSGNSGVNIILSDSMSATFSIKCSDWGVYSPTDCKVTVINNVTSSSSYDFTYIIDGENYLYSANTDFTSVFSVDGGDIEVNEDGEFELCFRYSTIQDILAVYAAADASDLIISSDVDIHSYPYFAIRVTPPDGMTAIDIPFVYEYTYVKGIELEDGIIF